MLKKAILASAILAAAAGAQAQTAGFSVVGTVSPPSCTLTLANSGTVDYGTLSIATVRKYTVYVGGTIPHYNLNTKLLSWTVACTAAMPLQLVLDDNQSGKVSPMDANDSMRFGIVNGASGTTSVGSYAVLNGAMSGITLDSTAVVGYLTAPKGTTTWTTPAGPTLGYRPGNASGFIKTAGQTTPSTMTNANGVFSFAVYVHKATVDAATSDITLNGSATITLQYL